MNDRLPTGQSSLSLLLLEKASKTNKLKSFKVAKLKDVNSGINNGGEGDDESVG